RCGPAAVQPGPGVRHAVRDRPLPADSVRAGELRAAPRRDEQLCRAGAERGWGRGVGEENREQGMRGERVRAAALLIEEGPVAEGERNPKGDPGAAVLCACAFSGPI